MPSLPVIGFVFNSLCLLSIVDLFIDQFEMSRLHSFEPSINMQKWTGAFQTFHISHCMLLRIHTHINNAHICALRITEEFGQCWFTFISTNVFCVYVFQSSWIFIWGRKYPLWIWVNGFLQRLYWFSVHVLANFGSFRTYKIYINCQNKFQAPSFIWSEFHIDWRNEIAIVQVELWLKCISGNGSLTQRLGTFVANMRHGTGLRQVDNDTLCWADRRRPYEYTYIIYEMFVFLAQLS